MATAEAEASDWTMDRTVAEMADAGAFGRGCVVVSCEPDVRLTGQCQFASTVRFGSVSVRTARGEERRTHELVFKLKHRLPGLRELYKTDMQFHNEILFYERIVPLLSDSVPAGHVPTLSRYLYGRNDCGDRVLQDMIVLENATPRGYRLSDSRIFLDLDHAVAALRTLAKFHGLSYRTKHKDPARFAELMADVKETFLLDDGQCFFDEDAFQRLFLAALDRLAERRGGREDDRTRRFREEFLNDGPNRMVRAMKAAEPLAVLCHGDFNRNNLLFRYDGDGKPADVLPFDMATVRYGSPALDLSFFLFMNADRQVLDAHWDELLDAYCAALSEAVADVTAGVRVPDRAQLDAEMRERAFYGLFHVSYFTRMMFEDQKPVDLTEFIGMDSESFANLALSYGNDKAVDRIADVVQFFIGIAYAPPSTE